MAYVIRNLKSIPLLLALHKLMLEPGEAHIIHEVDYILLHLEENGTLEIKPVDLRFSVNSFPQKISVKRATDTSTLVLEEAVKFVQGLTEKSALEWLLTTEKRETIREKILKRIEEVEPIHFPLSGECH